MFSRMSANRFEKDRTNPVGPGSYRIPAVFDEASVTTDRTDRSQETETSVGSFQVFEDAQERVAPRTPKRRPLSLARARQENRIPPYNEAGVGSQGNLQDTSDVDQLRKRFLSGEANVGDYAVAKRSASRAHAQVQAKDRQMEELRRQVEDLITHQAQAQKRIGELEQEKHLHRKVLTDKDETIVALQKSIQHSKAQLEDRNRRPEAHDLTSTRELAVEQAHRLKEQDIQLKDRTRELEAAHQHLDCLEKQFMRHFQATEVRLKELTESQERIHSGVLERDSQSAKRARELERALKERQCHEARVVGQLSVRQASLEATVELLSQEQRARKKAEARATSLAGELEALKSKAPVPAPRSAEEQEAAEDLHEKFAELRGRLFLAEQAETLGKGRRQELEEALAAKSADVNRLLEAQEDLRRSMEELESAKLEVEACNEVQLAELEALRIEVKELRSRASAEEAAGEAKCNKAVVCPEATVDAHEAEAPRECATAVMSREAFAEAFGAVTAGLEAEDADAASRETASAADRAVEVEEPQACGEAEGAGAGSDAGKVAACAEEVMQHREEAGGAGAGGDEASASLEESMEAEGTYSDDSVVSAEDATEAEGSSAVSSEAATPREEHAESPEADGASANDALSSVEEDLEVEEASSDEAAASVVGQAPQEAEVEVASASEATALVNEDVEALEAEAEAAASASEATAPLEEDAEASAAEEDAEAEADVASVAEAAALMEDSEPPVDTSASVAEAEGLDRGPASRLSVASEEVCDCRDDSEDIDWVPSRALAASAMAHALEVLVQAQPSVASLSQEIEGSIDLQVDPSAHIEGPCGAAN